MSLLSSKPKLLRSNVLNLTFITEGNYNFKKYTHGQADYYGEGYDFDSVMHYGSWAFSKNNKKTIEAIHDPTRLLGQRDGFSQTDVKQLNKLYKCRGYENVKVPPPKGNCYSVNERVFERVFESY